jgi:hypothetical protein
MSTIRRYEIGKDEAKLWEDLEEHKFVFKSGHDLFLNFQDYIIYHPARDNECVKDLVTPDEGPLRDTLPPRDKWPRSSSCISIAEGDLI